MGRKPRQFTEHHPYHVTSRCNNRNFYFQKKSDFELYLDTLKIVQNKYPFSLFAYVIMSNHVHLIIKATEQHPLDKIMHAINLTFAKRYNRIEGRCGHLWMNRYNAALIEGDAYLHAAMRYVMRNPLSAGIVTRLKDWQWSSYHYYCHNKRNDLLVAAPVQILNTNQSQYYRDLITQEWPSDNP